MPPASERFQMTRAPFRPFSMASLRPSRRGVMKATAANPAFVSQP